MSITKRERERRMAEKIRAWEQQLKANLSVGDSMTALMVENWLFGAERTLKVLGLTDLARLARAAQASPIATEHEATK